MAGFKYVVNISHEGLGKSRVISGSDPTIVNQKAQNQQWEWDEQWRKVQAKQAAIATKEARKQTAAQRTREAQQEFQNLQQILQATLYVNDVVDWETLKDRTKFSEAKPQKPAAIPLTREPLSTDTEFKARLNIFDYLVRKWRENKHLEASERFRIAHSNWVSSCEQIARQNEGIETKHFKDLQRWEERKLHFEKKQADANSLVDKRKLEYMQGDSDAILEYCDIVLSNSEYPDWMPSDWDFDYAPEGKVLIVEYQVPEPADLPTLKEVKYVQARDDISEAHYPESVINKTYDLLLYQICLRTIHELFEADVSNAIDYIVFNGIVESIDKATGKEFSAVIMSIQVEKKVFLEIDLANVEPKTCFRKLKGVSSSSLHGMAAVPPVMQINKSDKRFIDAIAVVDDLSSETNLAAMDWEEFEHLVRELFEKEFSHSGGEVKVTQASRDGGVDAVAFDPDPIRGGKIVIQAKRYTGTVGLSAVRDLYGTVVNEGATKGILITTSDYGPDAYEFAKSKPLTLLNGGNLLHLLSKHGHRARIDIGEARKILKGEA